MLYSGTVGIDSPASKAKQVRTGVSPSRMLRLGLAACALVIWGAAAVAPVVAPALATHAAGGSSITSGSSSASSLVPQATAIAGNSNGSATYYQVLETAGKSCPAGHPIPMLTDYVPAYNLSNYYIYPRKVALVGSSDPFDSTTLAGYSGGCLLVYSQQEIQRAKLFGSQLQVITCSFDGCLYSVK